MPFHHSDFNALELQHRHAMEDRNHHEWDNKMEQQFLRESWQEALAKRDHRRKTLRSIENVLLAIGMLAMLSMGAWIGPVARLVTGWVGKMIGA